MDGGFGSVTFICSKTDDISLTEAQESLDLEEELGKSWEKLDALSKRKKALNHDLEEMKENKGLYMDAINNVDEEIETWEGLKDDLAGGKTVHAPTDKGKSKKRKRSVSARGQKRQRRYSDSEEFDRDYKDEKSSDEESHEQSEEEDLLHENPLTETEITSKLSELRATRKESRSAKVELEERLRNVRCEIESVKTAEEDTEAKISAICIAGRNQYSKGAIQQDYAAGTLSRYLLNILLKCPGIKELDQELAAEDDGENFNPDVEFRDYDEVARSLPVFCVSSRGYQKLQGRLRKDVPVLGFKTIENTEIPQLQKHCMKLTEAGRSADCRRFVNNLSQLLNSLSLWTSSDGTGTN